MEINEAQKQAITHHLGACMVLAGPGSGKTFILTRRIIHMIKTCQIEPSEILVITFTRAAAGEMQERFLKLCNGEHPPVTFGTFHAVFYAILKETAVCGSGSILSEAEKKKLLKDIIKRNRYEISTNGDMLEEILSEIGRYQNLDLRCIPQISPGSQGAAEPAFVPQNMEPDLFWNIYRDFTETKEILRKIDFDDMALKCEGLFQKRPDILKRYQKRYKYLLVDEFQDISPIQYRIVQMLAKPENNLFIVGDDDQSIYGFRGSKPDIMKNFPTDFPEAKIITLPVNYRSTPEIVEAASLVISRNKNRFPKDIKAWNDAGQAVKTEKFATSDMQDKALIQYLTDEKNAGNLSDCAIICRTGASFMVLSEKLRQADIPCVFREKTKSIFDHEIVGDLLSYLEFANEKKEERSRMQFFRFMNRPLRYISREAVGEKADFSQMVRYYQGRPAMQETLLRLQADLERIKGMPVFLAVNYIRKAMGYEDYCMEQYGQAGLELMDLVQGSTRGCKTVEQWRNVIDERRREKPVPAASAEGVTLLTMHASKGLEYGKVFMINCNEGITPHRKARTSEEIEEERRMFYVGMTRAKKELVCFYVSGGGKEDDTARSMPPSRFLGEFEHFKN